MYAEIIKEVGKDEYKVYSFRENIFRLWYDFRHYTGRIKKRLYMDGKERWVFEPGYFTVGYSIDFLKAVCKFNPADFKKRK